MDRGELYEMIKSLKGPHGLKESEVWAMELLVDAILRVPVEPTFDNKIKRAKAAYENEDKPYRSLLAQAMYRILSGAPVEPVEPVKRETEQ